jgi:hypothetical protein
MGFTFTSDGLSLLISVLEVDKTVLNDLILETERQVVYKFSDLKRQ